MQIQAIRTDIFEENESLADFIAEHMPHLQENDIVVITSKVVALSEGRTAPRGTEAQKDALIQSESDYAIKTGKWWLTIKDGAVLANAGIDESNADNKIILLPKDSFEAAEILRAQLLATFSLENLGLIITDSRLLPLRSGVVGIALGFAGFKGKKDLRGLPDIYGRPMAVTQVDVADSIATAAVLLMGESNEQCPLALVTDAPVEWTEESQKGSLTVDPKIDLYAPLFQALGKDSQQSVTPLDMVEDAETL